MRLRVVAIGSPWASDDAAAHHVAAGLKRAFERAPAASDCCPRPEFIALRQPDVKLLDIMARCDILILIDAVHTGAAPGTVHCLEWQPGLLLSRGVERASSHGLSVDEVLRLAETLGLRPARVLLWGIEAASTAPGEGLSPQVAAALPAIRTQLEHRLRAIMAET